MNKKTLALENALAGVFYKEMYLQIEQKMGLQNLLYKNMIVRLSKY